MESEDEEVETGAGATVTVEKLYTGVAITWVDCGKGPPEGVEA